MKPVLDLEAHDPVDSDVVPDRHAELTAVRDKTCVFPWCTRTARHCDTDHTIPPSRGGPTCPCNLAPLCRRHHRIKTHGGWTYTTLEPGVYLWTSKHGYHYLERPRRHPRRQPRPPPRPRLADHSPGPRQQSGAIGTPCPQFRGSRRLLRNLLNHRMRRRAVPPNAGRACRDHHRLAHAAEVSGSRTSRRCSAPPHLEPTGERRTDRPARTAQGQTLSRRRSRPRRTPRDRPA